MEYEVEDSVPFAWKIGDQILGKYEILEIFQGGMGLVYRAYDREWDIELAIKTPREDYFQTPDQIEAFRSEAENWMKVGMHPNVATCFYIQNLGRSQRIFAEFVEGGSLAEWITAGRYKIDGEIERSRAVLSLAIQFAQGLEHAHNQGLIHQDVKPANVMMTADGSPKVTDFGLANARIPAGNQSGSHSDAGTILVAGAGYLTEAYASPEQASGKPLSRKTDIWSWAVSILEVINGGRDWSHGQAAPHVLEAIFEGGVGGDPLGSLLLDCFAWKPDERPEDFGVIIQRLRRIYEELIGEEFPSLAESLQVLSADSLNNRGVSLIQIGKAFSADGTSGYECFSKLFELNPNHVLGRVNKKLWEWRNGQLSIREMTFAIENILAIPESEGKIPTKWAIAFYLETRQYRKAISLFDRSPERDGFRGPHPEKLRASFKEHLAGFFSQLQSSFRDVTLKHLNLTEENLRSSVFDHVKIEASSAHHGVIAYINESREVEVFDTRESRIIFQFEPEGILGFTISENGAYLLVLCSDGPLDKPYRPFRLFLLACESGSLRELPNKFQIPSRSYSAEYHLVISEDSASAGIFIKQHNRWTKVDYIYDSDSDKWSVYHDFRHTTPLLLSAEMIRMSGNGKNILAASDESVQVWEASGTNLHRCIYEINFADFGLIRTDGYLPNFELECGWDFMIDQWNIYDVLNELLRLKCAVEAPYLIAKPPTWTDTTQQAESLKMGLRKIDSFRLSGKIAAMVEEIDKCLTLEISEKNQLLGMRHEFVETSMDRCVSRAWLESSANEYWESDIVGACSQQRDQFDVYQFRKCSEISDVLTQRWLNTRSLSGVKTLGTQYFGVGRLGSDRFLFLTEDFKQDLRYRAVLIGKEGTGSFDVVDEWALSPDYDRVETPNGVWRRDKFSWFACSESRIFYRDGGSQFSIRDGFSGREIIRSSIDDTISFVKRVNYHGADCLAIGTATHGVVRVFSCEGILLEVFDVASGQGGFVEDVSYNLEFAVIFSRKRAWYHVGIHDRTHRPLSRSFSVHKFLNGGIGWLGTTHQYRLSHCGRAVVGASNGWVRVIDPWSGRKVLDWLLPWDFTLQCAPCFDASGRWLIVPHSINKYEIFQLQWDIAREQS